MVRPTAACELGVEFGKAGRQGAGIVAGFAGTPNIGALQ